MSVGTGIFLSSVLLGVIVLFVFTKDRWKWKNIIFWTAGAFVSLVGVLLGWVHVDSYLSSRPKLQQVYWDIPITAKRGDVRFTKGEPHKADKDPDSRWTYDVSEAATYWVAFKGDALHYVVCAAVRAWDCESVQGIQIGDSYQEIVGKFGEPSAVSISNDELTRIVSYDEHGVFFTLAANKVEALGMYHPDFGPIRFKTAKNGER